MSVSRSAPRTQQLPALRLTALAVLLATTLAGCSVFESDRIDYKSAQRANTLEVPPDLTQLQRESRYVVPGAGTSVTASGSPGGGGSSRACRPLG